MFLFVHHVLQSQRKLPVVTVILVSSTLVLLMHYRGFRIPVVMPVLIPDLLLPFLLTQQMRAARQMAPMKLFLTIRAAIHLALFFQVLLETPQQCLEPQEKRLLLIGLWAAQRIRNHSPQSIRQQYAPLTRISPHL